MAKQQRIDPRAVERTRDSGYGAASKKPSNGKAPASPSKARGKSGRPGGRPEVEAHPAKFGDWVAAARIPTLALGIAPVALGTAAASLVTDNWWDHWVRALLCLAVALSLQIGVNYANDYSDGIRGADKNRIGPPRLVGSGRARPRAVLTAALVFFGIAAVGRPGARLADAGVVAARGGGRLHRSRLVLHRWQAPLRLLRLRRAGRVHLLRHRSRRRDDVRAGASPSTSRPGSRGRRPDRSRPRCCSSTTCAIASRTPQWASARSRC